MDKIITVLGYKKFITEMSDAPDCYTFLLEPLCCRMPAWILPNAESEDSIPPQPPYMYMFTHVKQYYDLS